MLLRRRCIFNNCFILIYRIAKDVRHKLRTLRYNVAFLDRLIDAVFLNQFVMGRRGSMNEERKENGADKGIDAAIARELQRKIMEMDR